MSQPNRPKKRTVADRLSAVRATNSGAVHGLWRRAPVRKRPLSRVIESILVVTISTLACLMVGELAIRVAIHAPLLEDRDFRHDRVAKTVNQAVEYDSKLGWRLKPFISTEGFHTLQYGFRSNGANEVKVKSGGVLAVGSSFTVGSEVNDDETWPANLEKITGRNVNNAGQGGYVADQIIINGERLLPLIHPQALVVDLIPDSIMGVKYSSYGWPKPYFTVEQGMLVPHNTPVPQTPSLASSRDAFSIKRILGHLAFLDQFMSAFFADLWFSSEKQSFIRTNNDEVSVTCLLLDRLKRQADEAQVRLVVSMQYGFGAIINAALPDGDIILVRDCIERMGIQLVDEFDELRRLYESDPEKFRQLYVKEPDGSSGHKSPLGNLRVARAVAAALAQPPPEISRREAAATRDVEQWKSILDITDLSALFSTSATAAVQAVDASDKGRGYLLKAVGPAGEHYVASVVPESSGTLKLSVEARPNAGSNLRLQIVDVIDGLANGMVAEFDLQQLTSVPLRLGRGATIGSGMDPIGHGWYKLWIAVALPPGAGNASIIVQLANRGGAYDFLPREEGIVLRRVMIEQGEASSDQSKNRRASTSR